MIDMDEQRHAHDLVAAYVLGATTPAESAMVEEHLTTCARCRRLRDDLREVVSVLPELAGERTPPPTLKARVMAAIEAEPVRAPVAGAAVQPPTIATAVQGASTNGTYRDARDAPEAVPRPVVTVERADRAVRGRAQPAGPGAVAPRDGAMIRPRWSRQLVTLAALVALALVAAGSVGVWRILNGPQEPGRTYHVADGSVQGSLVYESAARRLTLTLSGLRPLDSAHVYELWLIHKTARGITRLRGIGEFHPTPDGHGSLDLSNQRLNGYNLAALTREPAPGSATPTTTPFAATALS